MMKRTAVMIAAATLACAVGATGVWAAGPGSTGMKRPCTTARCLFTDENGDGVCDYRGTGSCRNDADGDGICDYQSTGTCRKGGYGCRGGQRACRG